MNAGLRIIDVSLNRLTEALKVAEDLCRFELEDARLVHAVRALRKELDRVVIPLRREVVPFRGSRTDAGRGPGFDRGGRKDLDDVLIAGLKRAQEACRGLEEVCKIQFPSAVAAFKSARFRSYDLEQDIAARLVRRFDPGICAILDTATVGRERLEVLAHELARADIGMVQLREPKDLPTRAFLRDALLVRKALSGSKAKLIINDRVDIALAADADGVHLGQHDMPLSQARKLMPSSKIIGISVRTCREARLAEKGGADYLGAGAVFATPSKPDARVTGIPGLKAICQGVHIPVIAIGGITQGNARQILRAGADGVAVISAVFGNGSAAANLRRLKKALSSR